jgi:alpha-glucuronidase
MNELKASWKGTPIELKRQRGMGNDDYSITSTNGKIRLTASTDIGLLYGAYHLLRLQQIGVDYTSYNNIKESPAYNLHNPDAFEELYRYLLYSLDKDKSHPIAFDSSLTT